MRQEGDVSMQFNGEAFMGASVPLTELREEDLDTVSARKWSDFSNLSFGGLHFGRSNLGKLYFSENVVQTNIAVEVAVALGGNVTQIIDQSNIV
jgi:hypothetical protein